jgi:hypothetical protein
LERRLRLILIELIHVLLRVDVARHRGHALAIDDLQADGAGRTGRSGYDLAATDGDRAGVEDRTGDCDDADVGDLSDYRPRPGKPRLREVRSRAASREWNRSESQRLPSALYFN